ncbi:hypothetical protein B7Z17_04950 [Candidatus Saccharibacteria bacterium 32-49-10]|nr:MAG: hypothetical protein B7Z17_04950 [Candidatus Saccharibacteria bacterium 32-49-10]
MTKQSTTSRKQARTATGAISPKKEAAIRIDEDSRIARAAKISALTSKGSGFMNFIREQGVVGLAVGLAIGAAAGDTVKKLVDALINPIVQLIIGSQQGLEQAHTVVTIGGRTGDFRWGAFVSSLITLFAVAFVVYFIVRGLKLDKIDKKKD